MRQAVIFDLDGTLTVGNLDFDGIRAELGLTGGLILEALEHMTPSQRAAAEVILNRHESRAAETACLQDGAAETIAALRKRNLPVGILTRNAGPWARRVLDRFGIEVDGLRSREDGPIKPDPDGLFKLCAQFGADPEASWMVGDYLFDIQAGSRAGMTTVLMIGDATPPGFADQADHVIRSLPRLLKLVAPRDRA